MKGPILRILLAVSLMANLFFSWQFLQTSSDELDDSDEEFPFVLVEVARGDLISRVPATIEVVGGRDEKMIYPGTGLVSELSINAGYELVEQAVWGRVNGRPRLVAVFAESASFYRDLREGLKGSDVEVLQRFLVSRGFEMEVDGRFGTEVSSALREFRSDMGGDTGDARLDLGDLAFIRDPGVVSDVLVSPGFGLSSGAEVVTVSGTSRLFEVRLPVSIGANVVVGAVIRSDDFEGTVASSGIEVVDGERQVVLSVAMEAGQDRLVGETFPVSVEETVAEARLLIPQASIGLGIDGIPQVFVEGELVPRTVETGISSSGSVVITAGLDEGEVIISPYPS